MDRLSKNKASLRLEALLNPGVFLGCAIQPDFMWRKEFIVLPLKDVMELGFAAEIQPIRVHQIAVPDIGLHFTCKGRYNVIREGLCPGISVSSNPPSVDTSKQPKLKSLLIKMSGRMALRKAMNLRNHQISLKRSLTELRWLRFSIPLRVKRR